MTTSRDEALEYKTAEPMPPMDVSGAVASSLESKEEVSIHLERLAKVRGSLVAIWNKVQPATELSKKYTEVHTLEYPSFEEKKYNPYSLSPLEHENLAVTLSLLIQVSDAMVVCFQANKPDKWVPWEHCHKTLDFKVEVRGREITTITNQLHIELIKADFAGDTRAVSVLNGLLILFVQGFENVEKADLAVDDADRIAVKTFCTHLIPADENSACINIRTRMAMSYAMSDELCVKTFSTILGEATFACGESASYFAIFAKLIHDHYGKKFTADTGKFAVCTVDDFKNSSSKKIDFSNYALIKKSIETIHLFILKPNFDYIFIHAQLKTIKEKSEFFRCVLKEEKCIQPLAEMASSEEITELGKSKEEVQAAFDDLMQTKNPKTGKNMLGFAAHDCRANEITLGILIDNLSHAIFAETIIWAGITWQGGLLDKITLRLKRLGQEDFADSLMEYNCLLQEPSMDGFNGWLETVSHNVDFILGNVILANKQTLMHLLMDDHLYSQMFLKLKAYLFGSLQQLFISLLYYSGRIQIAFDELNDPDLIKLIKYEFKSHLDYSNCHKEFFDAILNIVSETKKKNLFGFLVGECGISVSALIQKMTPAGVELALPNACVAWSDTDLQLILNYVNQDAIKKLLYSIPTYDLFFRPNDKRETFRKNFLIVKNKMDVLDWMLLLDHHDVFRLALESVELFEFYMGVILSKLNLDQFGLFILFLLEHHYYPIIQNVHDKVNIDKNRKVFTIVKKYFRSSYYILNYKIPETNINLLKYVKEKYPDFLNQNIEHFIKTDQATFELFVNEKVILSENILRYILREYSSYFTKAAMFVLLKKYLQLFDFEKDKLILLKNLTVILNYFDFEVLKLILQSCSFVDEFIEELSSSSDSLKKMSEIHYMHLESFDFSWRIVKDILLSCVSADKKLNPLTQLLYDCILSTTVSLNNKTMSVLCAIECMDNNLLLIENASSDCLMHCSNLENIPWAAHILDVILKTLETQERKKTFLLKMTDCYFYEARLIVEHIGINGFLEMMQNGIRCGAIVDNRFSTVVNIFSGVIEIINNPENARSDKIDLLNKVLKNLSMDIGGNHSRYLIEIHDVLLNFFIPEMDMTVAQFIKTYLNHGISQNVTELREQQAAAELLPAAPVATDEKPHVQDAVRWRSGSVSPVTAAIMHFGVLSQLPNSSQSSNNAALAQENKNQNTARHEM